MQVQNMKLKLNIIDNNKILAKAHFKYNFFFNVAKKQHIFVETCLYEAAGRLPVMSSLLPHVLWGRSQVSLFFASVVSPVSYIIMFWYLRLKRYVRWTCLMFEARTNIIDTGSTVLTYNVIYLYIGMCIIQFWLLNQSVNCLVNMTSFC